MKSSLSHAVLSVEIRPSRAICWALTICALGAVAASFYAALAPLLQIALAGGAMLYALLCLRRHAGQRGRLYWRECWIWQAQTGVEQSLQLRSATLWPSLIVLVFRDAVGRRNLTFALWRDCLEPDAARQLRVLLRHGPVFGETEAV